jgi:dUTP pyrophosphatase
MEKTMNRGFKFLKKYMPSEFKMPKRATIGSAGYDIFNNTGADIVLKPNSISKPFPTGIAAYMLPDEVLMVFPRSSL